ncbi:MAG TPA: hypothetical protein VGI39_12575 [Polyangiaceae bacterium]|jgi:hypothetical protein
MPSPPLRLEPRGSRPIPLVFKQGAHPPYAIRWYGATSLFGHFRNFIASAIASESVDSRDWMRPLSADELLGNVLRTLHLPKKETLSEALDEPLWIDFVADTGDDRDVSLSVARMVFGEFVVNDGGEELTLPRGKVLLFGGDTAYPVATAEEIFKRVIAPWNEALREGQGRRSGALEGPPRVLLGIPGNHDWYDGLDGFGRMFRRRIHADERPAEALRPMDARRASRRGRKVGLVARGLHLDEVGGTLRMIADAGRAITAFFRGTKVARRRKLALDGYEPVQESSYWALPLAPGLELWGVDRQLGRLDFRQRGFFHDRRRAIGERSRIVFLAPDPALAFGERHDPGARMLQAVRLSFERDRLLYLSGDVHHYERRTLGRSLSVIAGGGGAFLHGTRIAPAKSPADCAYPDGPASRALVLQMPLKLMLGRAGYLVHIGLAFLASLSFGAGLEGGRIAFRATALLITAGIAAALYGIAGHHRTHPVRVFALALPFALIIGLMPWGLAMIVPHIPRLERETAAMLVYAFLGSLVFGLFLATLAIGGIEHQQAFTVLGHPGFKHFVRLRISPDGTIDAWVIGKDDPLASDGPWLIDRWTWQGEAAPAAPSSATSPPG